MSYYLLKHQNAVIICRQSLNIYSVDYCNSSYKNISPCPWKRQFKGDCLLLNREFLVRIITDKTDLTLTIIKEGLEPFLDKKVKPNE